MNFRKLLTYFAFGTAAVMPFAGAQNPTILQGNYITNVFGNSNFVLNPNAQTNVANVTVSSATVTRSTTTPLVATSEFNITTSTSTGYADWSTRTFDAGMKGQNCEARFTYRGFSVGSTTAQILQGANVVAQLTLTASTDPRIASINFPCGDLSSTTTFRLQQATASLTGTNEIGGIYVGLATNMANVAQAEFVGAFTLGSASLCNFSTTSTSYVAFTASNANCPTPTAEGNVAAVVGQEKTPQFTVNAQKSGRYFIVATAYLQKNGTTAGPLSLVLSDGTDQSAPTSINVVNAATGANVVNQHTFNWTTPGTRTIQMKFATYSASNTLIVANDAPSHQFIRADVYRFPSSSELVVKPETQNVFGGVKWSGNADFSQTSTIASTIVNTTNFGTPTAFGKAAIASSACGLTTNDVGVCFQNVPPGTYEVTTALETGAIWNFGTAGAALCSVRVEASGTSLANTYVASALTEVATSGAEDLSVVSSGTFTVTSFQPTLALAVRMSKSSNTGRCLIRSQSTGNNYVALPTITMKAIDQPSNSALYVQGPVLGAQTGAAIPEGYVNEWSTREISDTSMRSQATPTAATWYYPWTGELTLPAGNWNLCYSVVAQYGQTASTNYADLQTRIQNKTDDTTVILDFHSPSGTPGNITGLLRQSASCKPIAITASKVFRVGIKWTNGSGTPTVNDLYLRGDLNTSRLYAIRLN